MPTAPSEAPAREPVAAGGWRARAAHLFPPVPPSRLGARHLLVAVLAVAAGAVAVLLRQTGAGALDTVYAEDGQVFLQQLLDEGFAGSLLEPYAGYGHLAPRVLVLPAGAVPAGAAAEALAVAAATATALLALLTFRALRGHLASWPLRAVAAAAVVLLPAGQEEAWNVVANVHWFLVPVAAILLLFDPTSRGETALAAAVVFVAAASDPIAVALLPLAAVRLLAAVPPRTRVVPLALGIGLVAQAVVVAGGGDSRGSELDPLGNPAKLVLWWLHDVPGRTLAGSRWVDDIDAAGSWVVALAAVVGVAALGWLAWRRLDRWALLAPAALVTVGAVLYAAYAGLAGARPPRYGVPAGILLVAAVAVTVEKLWSALDRRAATRLVAAAGAVTVVVWAVNYRVDTRRSEGPRWSDELDAARLRCDGADGVEVVPIVPEEPWAVELTCDRLD